MRFPRATRCPLYRQAQIYARSGLDLHRSTLAGWVGKAAFHLKPVVDRLAWRLRQSGKLFMDETRAPVLDPGRGRTKTGWLWALARDDRGWGGPDPPGVVCFHAAAASTRRPSSRGSRASCRWTATAATTGLPARTGRCGWRIWMHARRKVHEVFESTDSKVAAEGLPRIVEFYAIEAEIRAPRPSRERTPCSRVMTKAPLPGAASPRSSRPPS